MPSENRILAMDTLVDSLFPFHLRFESDSEGKVCGTGAAIKKLFGRDLTGELFNAVFKADRPAAEYVDRVYLDKNRGSVIFLSVREGDLRLRGQIEIVEDDTGIFFGSLLVNTASVIDQQGLKLGDFAPHDTTPDVVILHRFREMQISDIQRKNTALLKALEERDEFSEQASIDPLTGVYNRRAFWKLCQGPLGTNPENRQLGIFVVDLDGFKQINDEYGHSAGDFVLQLVASRLRQVLSEKDIVGRLGGDEFAVLISAPTHMMLHEFVAKIHDELSKPISQSGVLVDISASFGAVEAINGRCLDDLVSDADIAMYAGRQFGAGQVTWYTREMRDASEEIKILSQDLRKAINSDKINQVYQPIMHLKSGTVAAFEVLARWRHPERGDMLPDKFIDVAQRAGLVSELDRLMLSASLKMLQECHSLYYPVTMQVNFSGQSITPDLPDYVESLLLNYGIAPHFLTIELTETWIVNNLQETADILNKLAELGVNLHLDDFGTGYSSLSHLQSFPINGLKIDRSFVNKVMEDDRSRQLIDATMAIAKSLKIEVVAEGIETPEQAQYVTKIGCTFGQGYWYSKPVHVDQAMQMLSVGNKAA